MPAKRGSRGQWRREQTANSEFANGIGTFDEVGQATKVTEENAVPLGNLEAPRSPRPWLRVGASGRFLPTR